MKRLKLTQKNYEGYTGPIGRYAFVDGVSVDPIPANERIRIGGNFHVVELDEDGAEGANPSPAVSVVAGRNLRLAVRKLPRQSDEDKATENAQVALGGTKKLLTILTREALEDVASAKGIAGLRKIAVNWNVKSKSINVLLQMILDAQDSYVAEQRRALALRGIEPVEIERLLEPKDALPEVKEDVLREVAQAVTEAMSEAVGGADADAVAEVVEDALEAVSEAVTDAAITGDLAAALNEG